MRTVTLDHVVKRFGRRPGDTVVTVDLAVRAGEFFTLLGASGCGKTTTLRMVAGFYYPSSGRIAFDDRDVTRLPPNRRDTAMVFQSYALFPHMSVGENVAYGLKVRRIGRAERRRRAAEALEMVRLGGYDKRRVDQLSGGQQQRVALARALVLRPSVLLLDEPLSNLDAKLREETRTEIRKIQREAGLTALYVTHDQDEAMAMSDRIAVMDAGRVEQIGSPQDIYNRPRTAGVARFIGNTNLLELPVTSRDRSGWGVRLPDGSALTVPAVSAEGSDGSDSPEDSGSSEGADEVLTVSVRPESLIVTSSDEPDVMRGKVRTAEFTGATTQLAVDVAGTVLTAAVADRGERFRAGDLVGLRPDPAQLWVIRP